MLNEGRGISDINKIETENIFNIFKNNGFSTFDHQILNKNINVTFEIGNYDSKFYKKQGDYYILITCPYTYIDLKVKTIITHELNHFIEISKIDDKKYTYPNYNNIKKSLLEFNANNKQMLFFTHLIYKILDNEINANVSQTYTYLRSFNTNDEKELKRKLEEYDVRIEYKKLLDFDIQKFKNDIKNNNISFDKFNNILLKNNVGKFMDFVKNKKDDDKYIDSWFKIIKSNIHKLLNKQEELIKEIIEDINEYNNYSTYYPINDNIIYNFNEYLQNNLQK